MLPSIFLGFLAILFHQTAGIIDINGFPYDQVPALTSVDAYAPCLRARGDTYCFVSATLHGDDSHALYNALVKYSEDTYTHFNRTNIHRGVCLKKTCHEFLKISSNMTVILEACLNATLDRDYGLNATVFRTLCSEYKEGLQLDASDFTFGATVLALVMLNLVGSLYDFYNGYRSTLLAKFLLCFSLKRNWQRLMAPEKYDSGQRLLGLSSNRVLLSLGVIVAHSGIAAFHAMENPEYLEQTYDNIAYVLLHRSAEAMQLCFVISGLLLVYHVKSEECVRWQDLHKALIRRWIRFTPIYAVILFFICTWARHIGEGPFWRATMEVEINDCQRHWWLHLLYIHNYIDNSRCMIHSWSMAVEVQLTAVGCFIFYVFKSDKARKAAIALVLAVGFITQVVVTYYKNLDPVVVFSPELYLGWFTHDSTFNNMYKRGHTNLVSYTLGLALGFVIHNLKNSKVGMAKYKIFRVLHWLMIPGVFLLHLTGSVFFDAKMSVPVYVRLFYSSIAKLIAGLLMCAHIYITVVLTNGQNNSKRQCLHDNKEFQGPVDHQRSDNGVVRRRSWMGDVLTTILNLHFWTPLSRLTYCVFMVHMLVLRFRAGSLDQLFQGSGFSHIQEFIQGTILSFLVSLPLFLLVEAPFDQLTRILVRARYNKKHVD